LNYEVFQSILDNQFFRTVTQLEKGPSKRKCYLFEEEKMFKMIFFSGPTKTWQLATFTFNVLPTKTKYNCVEKKIKERLSLYDKVCQTNLLFYLFI